MNADLNSIVLTAEKNTPSHYRITNTAHVSIWINHVKKNPGAGAGFASLLSPGRYAILQVAQPRFDITCQQQKKMQYVSCGSVLKIERLPYFPGKQAVGDYWIKENQKLVPVGHI